MSILGTQQFQQLEVSPTAANENKIQREQRKMKSNFVFEEYNILYPTGSNAGKFYRAAKLDKLSTLGFRSTLNITTSNIHHFKY